MARIGAAVLAYKLLDCACITDMVFRLVKATNSSAIAGIATAIASIHFRENLLMIMSRTYRSEVIVFADMSGCRNIDKHQKRVDRALYCYCVCLP